MEGADVVIGVDGSIRLARPDVAASLRARAGAYQLAPSPPDLLTLRRLGGVSSRITLSGLVSERGTLLAILQFLAGLDTSGELIVLDGECRRALMLDRGTLILATSSAPGERLGEVLFRHGAISRAQFDEAMALLSPARRLGDIVVQKGWIKPNDLYGMLQTQVREIAFNALAVERGQFHFAHGIDASNFPVRVNISTGSLLMEAVQRIDEWAYFRERIPSDQVVPSAVPGRHADGDPQAERILAEIDGTRTLAEIARDAGLGEFDATKALFVLLQSGAARLGSPAPPRAVLEARIGGFNAVLLDIHRAVDEAGVGEQARETLAMFLQGGGAFDVLFANAGPAADGAFDAEILLNNLQRIQTDDPDRAATQALHEYVAFALFAAGSVLRRDEHQRLTQHVQRQLSALRPSR
jgi:hypothetical protein